MDNISLEEILFKYRWLLLIASLGIIFIAFGIFITTRQLPFFEGDKVEVLGTQEGGGSQELVVEVGGAVEKPGVYKFAPGARVEEALVASGGLSAAADREWVVKVLNRAAKLTDGQKIYIKKVGESSRSTTSRTGRNTSGVSFGSPEVNGLVNINTASESELDALPGIGPVTAKKITEGRPYSAPEELLTRKILSKKVFEENKSNLSVY